MIDERKLTRYIKTEINPYGKPFDGTVFEFGNMLIDYMERMEKEPERIIKQLEELRDDPIMHCSEDYWEGHYMAAKEAIAIVRGEEE